MAFDADVLADAKCLTGARTGGGGAATVAGGLVEICFEQLEIHYEGAVGPCFEVRGLGAIRRHDSRGLRAVRKVDPRRAQHPHFRQNLLDMVHRAICVPIGECSFFFVGLERAEELQLNCEHIAIAAPLAWSCGSGEQDGDRFCMLLLIVTPA